MSYSLINDSAVDGLMVRVSDGSFGRWFIEGIVPCVDDSFSGLFIVAIIHFGDASSVVMVHRGHGSLRA